MSTETASQPPEIKSLDRMGKIPLVQDSLSAIDQTLTAYTPTIYAYGKAVSTQAYSLSTPIQVRLAPLIVSADGYALKGLDVAQERFPTPFSVTAGDVVDGIRSRKDGAVDAVTRRGYGIANGVDSSLSPIVDRIEGVVHRIAPSTNSSHSSDASDSSEASSSSDFTQVGRLYTLSHQIYALSADQIKALQTQNVYIQSATEQVNALNANLTAYYGSTRDKSLELVQGTKSQAQAYTNSILHELEKIQNTTRSLPGQVQVTLQPLQEGISAALTEISGIVRSDAPVGDKVSKVGTAVQDRVQPLLAQTTETLQAYIAEAKAYLAGAKQTGEKKANGYADQANGTVDEAASEANDFIEKGKEKASEASS